VCMSKGGGGGVSTAGLEESANKALALYQQNLDQTRKDVQPWYQMGTGAVSRLSDLLGISGGSVRSRDQIYNEMLPQYQTTQSMQSSGSPLYIDSNGNAYDANSALRKFSGLGNSQNPSLTDPNYRLDQSQLAGWGLKQMGGSGMDLSPTTTTDYTGLNSAVDAAMSGQGTPSDYGSLLQSFGMDQYQEDPGYAFRKEQGQKALERSMAAQGITLGGAGFGDINPRAAQALEDYSQGVASQEYQNAYGRYVNDQMNKYNMLMGAAGMGQGSTNTMAATGANTAAASSDIITGLSSAQMNAQLAKQASKGSMFSNLLGAGSQLGGAFLGSEAGSAWLAGALSDRRLKENITHVGKENGHNIYEFDYKDGSGRFRGVMADEVEKINPEAVMIHSNGFKMVDYGKIGLKMESVSGV